MSSSTSSSDWRRFFRLAAGTAVLAVALIYAFVVLVDPFDTLPLSPPADRVSQRQYALRLPSLARSAVRQRHIGVEQPVVAPVMLDHEFGARFVNLAMNAATAWNGRN
jgi:hypothetical protein